MEFSRLDTIKLKVRLPVVNFRQSGNAPEMRIYVETGERDLTERLLGEIKRGLGIYLGAGDLFHE